MQNRLKDGKYNNMRIKLPLYYAIQTIILFIIPHPADAGTDIQPTSLVINGEKSATTLTVTNDRTVPAGYTAEALGWEQTDDGTVLLPPTADIAVSPATLDIPAHGSAQIQITSLIPAPHAGEAEKFYRIRISERTDRPKEEGETIQMIGKVTLPVFLAPPMSAPHGAIETTPLKSGHLSFAVGNSGTRHAYVRDMTATGRDKAGKVVFRIVHDGWYVLPNGRLTFAAELSARDCRRSRIITLEAHILDSPESWQTDLPTPPEQCGNGAVSRFLPPKPATPSTLLTPAPSLRP